MNRVPFDPAGDGTVVDPIFGRDISFFLFDLAFLRFVQVTVIGLVVASLIVAGARYLVAALDGSPVFSTPVRVHLGVLGGTVPDGDRGRLPARQVRAGLQQPRHRHRRQLHRRRTPSSSRTTC